MSLNSRRASALAAQLFLVISSLVLPLTVMAEPVATVSQEKTTYLYRMKGKVRLLFFWVGKDDVGGGAISVDTAATADSRTYEEIAVLFGSRPERVPGKINRWGYGRESAVWTGPPGTEGTLEESTFEGFIRHSKEESLSEVQANEGNRGADDPFLYDGIRSQVRRSAAASEIRTFSTTDDFDYRNAKPLQCSYQERLRGGPPDELKELPNSSSSYSQPFGFLTAMRAVTESVLAKAGKDPKWKKFRTTQRYVYNAQLYELKLKDIEHKSNFAIPLGTDGNEGEKVFKNVVQMDFRAGKVKSGGHDFTIWVPREGPYRGIPIRIVDKPRWWLRVELNLEPTGHESDPEVRGQIAKPNCATVAVAETQSPN